MGLQAQQIVSLACAIAKCPGFTTQAGQLLNSILSDLCQDYDFEVARTTVIVNLTAALGTGPYNLPADFLRTSKDEVFYVQQGVPYFPINFDQSEFDRFVTTAGLQNFPQAYVTDSSAVPPTISVWPPPSGVFPTTIRYFRQMPDIATPETSQTVPWFPNQEFLIRRLSGELMAITNDDRAAAFLGDDRGGYGAAAVLKRYLLLKDDPEGRVKTVSLDRRRFGASFEDLRNTKLVGW